MSGTSADGIDVAVVDISGGEWPRFRLLRHKHFSYRPQVQQAVLEAMNAEGASVADLARLNFLLGELYSNAVAKTAKDVGRLALVGCHGQTIYHQGAAALFLGRRIACHWQTG